MAYQIFNSIEEIIKKFDKNQAFENLEIVFEEEKVYKATVKCLEKMLEGLSNVYKFLNRAICNFNTLDTL